MFARTLLRVSRNTRHFSTKSQISLNSNRAVGFTAASLGLLTVALAISVSAINNSPIDLDVAKPDALSPSDSVSVDSSIDPFATFLPQAAQSNLHTDFKLLGYGMRAVTFLGINVYGIGIYLANADVTKVKKTLTSEASDDSVSAALSKPEASTELIGKLLDDHVRFAARICPVRNTDFTHLKDGLIKSILAHPMSKSGSPVRDQVGKGLEQLREVFQGHKGSVPKNHVLWLEILQDGKLSISYQNTKDHTLKTLGQVNEPLVGKVLFLQYMSGSKPLSEPLRKSCNQGYQSISN